MTRIATTAENNLTLFYMQQNQGQLKTLSTLHVWPNNTS